MAIGQSATVGGGYLNVATGAGAFVGGGGDDGTTNYQGNKAGGNAATIGGGLGNSAYGNYATVGGGESNMAGFTSSVAYATVGGGYGNTAGNYATVPGGAGNDASGSYSFAAGNRAKTSHALSSTLIVNDDGAFVWADSSNFDFNSAAKNEFAVRCTGGARFVTAIDPSGNPTQTVAISPSGNVGIGTSTPENMLHIGGGATSDVFCGIGPHPNTVVSGVYTGPAMNFGYSGNSFGEGSGFFNVRPDPNATAPNPSLRFMTVNSQRMIITNTGNVGIGTSSPAHLIQLSGGAYSDGTTWNPASSVRWKENIEPLTGGVDMLKQLHPVAYNYKKTPAKRTMGFIAEEVGKVLPSVVDWDKAEPGYAEGYDQISILALAVQAVKEQQTQLGEQQSRIEQLTTRNSEQQTQISEQQTTIEAMKKQFKLELDALRSEITELKRPPKN
jgi:hypothetical protein